MQPKSSYVEIGLLCSELQSVLSMSLDRKKKHHYLALMKKKDGTASSILAREHLPGVLWKRSKAEKMLVMPARDIWRLSQMLIFWWSLGMFRRVCHPEQSWKDGWESSIRTSNKSSECSLGPEKMLSGIQERLDFLNHSQSPSGSLLVFSPCKPALLKEVKNPWSAQTSTARRQWHESGSSLTSS